MTLCYPKESLDLGYRHSRFREGRVTHIDANRQLIIPPRNLIEPAELVVVLALRVHHDDPARLEAVLRQHVQVRTHDDPHNDTQALSSKTRLAQEKGMQQPPP